MPRSIACTSSAGFPGYDGHPDNNRPTQPLNDRPLERDDG
jgi:hypothetical protein